MKLNIPDKLAYKTTITNKLREEISLSASRFLNLKEASYLEIGFDKGLTMISLNEHFTKLVGIGIDPNRVSIAKEICDKICNQSLCTET